MWTAESNSKEQRPAWVRIFLKTEKKLIQFLVSLKFIRLLRVVFSSQQRRY